MVRRARKQMGREKCPWSEEEDGRLTRTFEYLQTHNKRRSWGDVARLAGLNRTGKGCNLRWNSYLKPSIKRGHFSEEEVATIMRLQLSVHRNKWKTIAAELPGRTNTDIKNLWNTRLKKKEKNLPNKETPPVLQELVATVDLLASTVNVLKDQIMNLHPDPDGIGSLFANGTSISTAPVSGVSCENQILESGEITPSDQEIANPSWFEPAIVNQELANPSFSTSATFENWPGPVWDDIEIGDFLC